ncbi:hypothetical protein [Szabonella alba]|uniref:Translation initiation factor 2 n=1 Tax=Szabonella alba TaxID=2804194 RepID=A0A8K0XYQ3_9RHOB|nr:hypothetical protein [Szabonella alba]MBL4916305.1 hypothetical protein [Szabonella alba]
MKPNFALDITESHVSLLHRTSRGWMPVGEVAFDNPDLEEAIGYLRASALGLSPQGMTTKLVLPRSQVLYLTVEAPGPDKATRRAQILEALDGRTPYAPDELVFDWWGKGPEVRVAVVARETLEEAEAFAETHRLNPVSFVTIPDSPEFAGEPWFGTSKLSAKLLPEGEKVTRDQDPVTILSRDRSETKSDTDAAGSEGADADKTGEGTDTAGKDADTKAAEAIAEAEAAAKAETEAEERAAAEAERVAADRAEADRMRAEATAREAEAERLLTERREAEKAARRVEEEAARRAATAALAAEKPAATPALDGDAGGGNATGTDSPVPTFASRRREERRAEPPLSTATSAATPALQAASPGNGFSAIARPPAAPPAAPSVAPPMAPPVASPTAAPSGTPRPLGSQSATTPVAAGPSLGGAPGKDGAGAMPSIGNPAPAQNVKAADGSGTGDKSTLPQPQQAGPLTGEKTPAGSDAKDVSTQDVAATEAAAGPAPNSAPTPAAGLAKPSAGPATPADAGKAPTVRIVPQGDVPPSQAGKTLLPRAPASGSPASGSAAPTRPVSSEGLSPAKRLAAMVTAAKIPGRNGSAPPRKPAIPAAQSSESSASTAKDLPQRPKALTPRSAATPGSDATGMGAFGDRVHRQRGKPRFLGLALTGVLLVVLALIAAWSSVYLSRDDSAPETIGVAGTETPGAVSTAALPGDAATDSPQQEVPTAETVAEEAEPLPAASETAETAAQTGSETETTTKTTTATDFRPEITDDAEAAGPGPAGPASEAGQQDEIVLAAMDGPPPAFDAITLPRPGTGPDAPPEAAAPPPPAGTRYEFEPDGTIRAGTTGVVTPDGFWLIAARPPILPPERPAGAEPEAETAEPQAAETGSRAETDTSATPGSDLPQDPAAEIASEPATETETAAGTTDTPPAGPAEDGAEADAELVFAPSSEVTRRRPETRPASAEPPEQDDSAPPASEQAEDDAALSTTADSQLAGARPRLRPEELAEAASLAAAAAAAEAEAAAARLAALPVPISLRPAGRPADFSRAVAAAVASATQASTAAAAAPAQRQAAPAEIEEEDEPEVAVSAAPRIPTRASVAQQATFSNAINLSRINLIGVYGTASNRYALVRSGNGRFTKVKVGDRIDGGTVAAITSNELRYQKGGRMLSLAMPRG